MADSNGDASIIEDMEAALDNVSISARVPLLRRTDSAAQRSPSAASSDVCPSVEVKETLDIVCSNSKQPQTADSLDNEDGASQPHNASSHHSISADHQTILSSQQPQEVKRLGIGAMAVRNIILGPQRIIVRPSGNTTTKQDSRDNPKGSVLNMHSQSRAAVANMCPTHEGCDGSLPECPDTFARPVLSGPSDSIVEKGEPHPAVTNGRTRPNTLGDTLGIYRYTRLEPRTIRLLKVASAVFRADPVVCEVIVCPIDHAPKYAALSYCWGNGSNDHKILLIPDGKVFMARRSLHAALKRFRAASDSSPLHGREEYIWADAICINQDDIDEKTEQLLMMHEIYSGAEAVYVDLGDAHPEWYSAYSLMTMAAVAAEQGPEAHPSLPSVDDISYVHYWTTFLRPWFTRTWIAQEFILGRRVMGMLGPCVFLWTELELSFCLLVPRLRAVPFIRYGISLSTQKQLRQGAYNFECLERIRFKFESGSLDSLLFMELTRNLHATKAKDKIFALLSLFPEDEKKNFNDYSLPAHKVFIQYAVAQVEKGRALELIDQAGLQRRRGSRGDLPSWVPDWTFKEWRNGPKQFSMRQKKPYRASGRLDPRPCLLRDGCLVLGGFLVDELMVVQDAAIITLDPVRVASYYDRQGFKRAQWWASEWYRASCAAVYPDVDQAFASLLVHTDPRDTDNSLISDPLEAYQEFMSMSFGELRKVDLERETNKMWRYIQTVRDCDGLKFSITKRGFMALVPVAAKADDRICVFRGQSVPFLLRGEGGAHGCLLIGDAYVHGIMSGQALELEGVSEVDIVLD